MVLTILYFFPNPPHKWKSTEEKKGNESVCQNEAASFGLTEQSEPPPEGVLNIAYKPNQKEPFHLTSEQNFCIFVIMESTQ